MVQKLSMEQIRSMLDKEHWPKVNAWLSRGDGIAVYENHDLGSPQVGHQQFLSFGSDAAQLPVPDVQDPPTRMPDFPNAINWRYQLVGTYRGGLL